VDPATLKLVTDGGPLVVTVSAVVYVIRFAVSTFKMLREEEAKRTEVFLSAVGEHIEQLRELGKNQQAAALTHQATITAAEGLVREARAVLEELKALRVEAAHPGSPT
jgi:hypothetical protein